MRSRLPGDTFESMVKKDPRVQKMHRFDKAGHYRMPFQKMTQTLLTLQESRRHRLIGATEFLSDSQTKIVDWSTGVSATFSRATKIRMHAFAKKRLLDEHLKTVRKYLMVEYGAYLKAEISTIKGREYAAKEALRYFENISTRLEGLILLADMLISELDKAGFSINHSIQAVQLSSRPERNL